MGGFKLRKWLTNDTALREHINKQESASDARQVKRLDDFETYAQSSLGIRHTSKPGPDSDPDSDSDPKKTRTREKPGPGLEKNPDSLLAKSGPNSENPDSKLKKKLGAKQGFWLLQRMRQM